MSCQSAIPEPLPSHHVPDPGVFFGYKFQNPWSTFPGVPALGEVLKWQRARRKAGINPDGYLTGNNKPTSEDFKRAFPLNPVDWAALAAPPPDTVQAVWVGHATVLVQMGGFTFITDPVFSERCAPVQFAGPKRVVAPALTGEEPQMPALDFVLLSHNHYDHLDTGSVRTLQRRYGKGLTWYVPLGLRSWFASEGVTNVVELDWWQSVTHAGNTSNKSVVITMVPAQHWTARGVLDRCRTLWGGYVVEAPQPAAPAAGADTTPAPAAAGGESTAAAPAPAAAPASAPAPPRPLRFYFVGDTGYCPVFTEIGKRFAPIDLAAVPIGAYDPRWFMKPQHVDAEEGLQVAVDVGALVSFGIHTATWALTDEPLDEPPTRCGGRGPCVCVRGGKA
ncbi:N-acyl-phosphatidylethanolamine-hydrolyzing phospholipase D [Tetrabaena socialis]|uniref:N-acyl-phosphatidylethanolamine-hydrolyzing phospholipase D n=1 Tax=Tetrabaena socialis TaxID=47790 RepID=A0A2J7ZLW2_9CHLO|nr:N-acyl-phosphatidylethanolamine-hydrolyzing phospholipase D [Tetrabaena socialis]|eukprot:PNH01258.1 N-acyl-phosphatidylethanolamine-hydrolyzing phospholipase D [Tetrabaena socialis]